MTCTFADCLDAPRSAAADITVIYTLRAEIAFREAGRLLELLGVSDPEAARLSPIAYRLASRLAVDSGRLESSR